MIGSVDDLDNDLFRLLITTIRFCINPTVAKMHREIVGGKMIDDLGEQKSLSLLPFVAEAKTG